jgi:hypothetical protein
VAYGSEPTAQRGEGKGEGVMDFCKRLKRFDKLDEKGIGIWL